MKSVRLDSELEARLKRAAEIEGVSESDFIRAAIAQRANSTIGNSPQDRLVGIIGAVRSERGYAARAHDHYRDLLRRDFERSKKSRR